MSRGLTFLAGGVILFANVQAHAQPLLTSSSNEQIEEYCVGCHNFEDYAGSLDLTQALAANVADYAETWEKVIRKLRAGMMPPPGEARPPESEYLLLTRDLENQVDRVAVVNPGSVTIHRLNRTEYANAIRDLLDLEIDPALLLPSTRWPGASITWPVPWLSHRRCWKPIQALQPA